MDLQSIIVSPFLIVFSLGMLLTAIVSYFRSKNNKLVFVSGVFCIFLIKGILLGLSAFSQDLTAIVTLASFGLLDVIIVVLLFIATLKR